MGLLRDYVGHLYKQSEQAQLGQQKLDQLTTEYENRGNLSSQEHSQRLTEQVQKNKLDTALEMDKSTFRQGEVRGKALEDRRTAELSSQLRREEAAAQQALDVAKRKDLYWYDLGEDALKGVINIGSSLVKGIPSTKMRIDWERENSSKK